MRIRQATNNRETTWLEGNGSGENLGKPRKAGSHVGQERKEDHEALVANFTDSDHVHVLIVNVCELAEKKLCPYTSAILISEVHL